MPLPNADYEGDTTNSTRIGTGLLPQDILDSLRTLGLVRTWEIRQTEYDEGQVKVEMFFLPVQTPGT